MHVHRLQFLVVCCAHLKLIIVTCLIKILLDALAQREASDLQGVHIGRGERLELVVHLPLDQLICSVRLELAALLRLR